MKNLAYCGYDCDTCPIYLATINKDLESLKKILKNVDVISIEKNGCLGCKSKLINHMCDSCYIKNCCEKQNINNCGECDKYSCEYTTKYLSDATKKVLDRIKESRVK